jgi:nucleoid-associated protein YgaU
MFGFGLDSEHVFGHHGGMSRARVRRRRAGVAVLASVGLAFSLPAAAGAVRTDAGAMRPVAARRYVVAPGDTLWRIAVRADPGRDPRAVVDQIERENAVDAASLQPGQVLVLPAAG